ncbi:MAG: 4-phosphoerythronate dehydrogenase, partial [Bacteroidota bacterium]
FSTLGHVEAVDTSEFTRERVREADALIVRSEVKVGRTLLEGSRVQFVGTTTIGTDHLELGWLESRGIQVASAPGCNANSVREYLLAALLVLGERHDLQLRGMTLGIVGVGNIGSRVRKLAAALGMNVLLNDPPLARLTGDPAYRPLEEVLDADIITLHVPLKKTGEDPTFHLIDEHTIRKMRRDAILINTSRGPIVANETLRHVLKEGKLRAAVLDVWEGEPEIDAALLELTDLGTPHIAGYSLDGKTNAVQMVYDAVCSSMNVAPSWRMNAGKLPSPQVSEISFSSKRIGERELGEIVKQCYDIHFDDTSLRRILTVPGEARRAYFQKLRTGYRVRREFRATRIRGVAPEDASFLRDMGFTV